MSTDAIGRLRSKHPLLHLWCLGETTPTYIKTPTHFWMTAIRQRPTPSSPEDSAGRTIRVSQFAEAKPTPSLLRVSTCQWRHPENSVKLNQSASGNGRCGCIQGVLGDRLPGNSGISQIRNVQRSSRSGLPCQGVAMEIGSTEVRIPSPLRLNDLGMNRTCTGGTNFTQGATGVVWLSGVSISLNAVWGRSTIGATETKVTAVTRRRRNDHLPRSNTHALQVVVTISRWHLIVKDFLDY